MGKVRLESEVTGKKEGKVEEREWKEGEKGRVVDGKGRWKRREAM